MATTDNTTGETWRAGPCQGRSGRGRSGRARPEGADDAGKVAADARRAAGAVAAAPGVRDPAARRSVAGAHPGGDRLAGAAGGVAEGAVDPVRRAAVQRAREGVRTGSDRAGRARRAVPDRAGPGDRQAALASADDAGVRPARHPAGVPRRRQPGRLPGARRRPGGPHRAAGDRRRDDRRRPRQHRRAGVHLLPRRLRRRVRRRLRVDPRRPDPVPGRRPRPPRGPGCGAGHVSDRTARSGPVPGHGTASARRGPGREAAMVGPVRGAVRSRRHPGLGLGPGPARRVGRLLRRGGHRPAEAGGRCDHREPGPARQLGRFPGLGRPPGLVGTGVAAPLRPGRRSGSGGTAMPLHRDAEVIPGRAAARRRHHRGRAAPDRPRPPAPSSGRSSSRTRGRCCSRPTWAARSSATRPME